MNEISKIAILLIILIQAGCAASPDQTAQAPLEPGSQTAQTKKLVTAIEAVNAELKTCKGLGRMRYVSAGRTQRFRIAWVSTIPEKLRVAVLGADGRPLITVAADGAWFYFLDHSSGEYQKSSVDGLGLKTVLRLPLDVRSLTMILAGRLPGFGHNRTAVQPGRTADETMVVFKKWWNQVGRITLRTPPTAASGPANSGPIITRIEAYNQTGEVRYIADIEATRQVKSFTVPRTLALKSVHDSRFTLDIDRYWANVPVAAETFVLQPPE